MICRDDILCTARSYRGTPYVHQGRLRGAGIDCAGLVMCTLRDVGINVWGWGEPYPRVGSAAGLLHMLSSALKITSTPLPGDVLRLWIRNPSDPVHCAILMQPRLIMHVVDDRRGVVEVSLDRWQHHVKDIWRIPNIGDEWSEEVVLPAPRNEPRSCCGGDL